MALFEDECIAAFYREFEEGDNIVRHKLSRNGSADKVWEFDLAASFILEGLNRRELVRSAFCLDWNDKMRSILVEANINLIDLDLTHTFDLCAQVVLE